MNTLAQNRMRGQEADLAREEGRNRFQFRVLDIALLLALHGVTINGVCELYRDTLTDTDFRGGLRQIGARIEGGKIGKMPQSIPPDPPPAPVVTIIGGRGFTAFWFRRFAKCVIVGSLAILISFFGTALLLRNANPHVRRAVPRVAAALICLLFVAALSGLTYLSQNPESYIEINGLRIHPAIHAAWWAIGPAIAVVGVIAVLEIASCLRLPRVRAL